MSSVEWSGSPLSGLIYGHVTAGQPTFAIRWEILWNGKRQNVRQRADDVGVMVSNCEVGS